MDKFLKKHIYQIIGKHTEEQTDFLNNSMIVMIEKSVDVLIKAIEILQGKLTKEQFDIVTSEFIEDIFKPDGNTITPTKIEGVFNKYYHIVNSKDAGIIDLTILKEYEGKPGVYFLYSDDVLMYVGKTNNLSTRPLESFINKQIYGVNSLKIYDVKEIWNSSDYDLLVDRIESVLIDYYTPILNTATKSIDVSHKMYTKFVMSSFNYVSESYEPLKIEINV
jgi:hypothetical protein